MSRVSVAVLGVRIVALWLMVSGLVTGLSLVVVRMPAQLPDVTTPTALLFGVLPFVTGVLLWSLGVPIAERVFRDAKPTTTVSGGDLYRVASVFVGLGLLGKAVPQAAALLSGWLASVSSGDTFLAAHGASALAMVQFKSVVAATTIQLLAGFALILWPWWVERALASLERPAPVPRGTKDPGGEGSE